MTVATAGKGKPTARQLEVYSWIFEQTARDGYQPSYREVDAHFGWCGPNAVWAHLRALESKGWVVVRRRPHTGPGRSIRFLRKPDGTTFRGFQAIE